MKKKSPTMASWLTSMNVMRWKAGWKNTLVARLKNQTGFANECLEYLLQIVIQCHWPRDLMTAMESHLLGSISEDSPYHLRNVIRIADNVESEGLKARAYHRFLCINKWNLSPAAREEKGRFFNALVG
jgi:hypothetical protein